MHANGQGWTDGYSACSDMTGSGWYTGASGKMGVSASTIPLRLLASHGPYLMSS